MGLDCKADASTRCGLKLWCAVLHAGFVGWKRRDCSEVPLDFSPQPLVALLRIIWSLPATWVWLRLLFEPCRRDHPLKGAVVGLTVPSGLPWSRGAMLSPGEPFHRVRSQGLLPCARTNLCEIYPYAVHGPAARSPSTGGTTEFNGVP